MSTIDTSSSFSSRSEIEEFDSDLNSNFIDDHPNHYCDIAPEISSYICTLNEKCLSVMTKEGFLKSVEDVAAISLRIHDLSSNILYQKLWDRVQSYLKDRGSFLVESYDHNDLEKCFGANLTSSLVKLHENRLDAEKKIAGYRSGQTVERKIVDCVTTDENGPYPIEALLEGVKWPEGLDPTRREEYLSSLDFIAVFKMDKETFMKLSTFMQIRLKKQSKLF